MISPTAEYALRAVVAIAQANGNAAATQSIAKLTKVPAGYLPKVLQMLGRAGLVDSRRGLGGGFRLAKPAGELTVLEVVNAVEPIKRILECPLDLESHGGNLCPLHKRLDEATEHVERSFAKTTIAELLAQPGRSTPFCDEPGNKSCGVQLGTGTREECANAVASRRHEALLEWSRDHTLGLAVAKHLSESSEKRGADRLSALQEFVSAWREDLADHFSQEEDCLLPVIHDERHAKRLKKEHAAIRANADLAEAFMEDDDVDATWLRGVGKLLHDHIRWEERELFLSIEQSASQAELQRIGKQVAKARSPGNAQEKKKSRAGRKRESTCTNRVIERTTFPQLKGVRLHDERRNRPFVGSAVARDSFSKTIRLAASRSQETSGYQRGEALESRPFHIAGAGRCGTLLLAAPPTCCRTSTHYHKG